jgi:hypothetical protein
MIYKSLPCYIAKMYQIGEKPLFAIFDKQMVLIEELECPLSLVNNLGLEWINLKKRGL